MLCTPNADQKMPFYFFLTKNVKKEKAKKWEGSNERIFQRFGNLYFTYYDECDTAETPLTHSFGSGSV